MLNANRTKFNTSFSMTSCPEAIYSLNEADPISMPVLPVDAAIALLFCIDKMLFNSLYSFIFVNIAIGSMISVHLLKILLDLGTCERSKSNFPSLVSFYFTLKN